MNQICSIGHSNKNIDDFIKELKDNDIELLVDLRSQPYSKHVPQYNKETLRGSLGDERITYLYFGDKLGGRPLEGIDVFIASSRFNENVTELLSKIKGKNTALMCSEMDYESCHRRFIIKNIRDRNIDVKIIGPVPQKGIVDNKPDKNNKQMSLGEFF